ncbi:hypothetical protein Plec18170_007599 [Paecilomyces lecythidis]
MDNCDNLSSFVSNQKDRYADIIRKFLEDISFELPNFDYDVSTVTDRVERHFIMQNFETEFIAKVRPIIRWSAAYAVATYPFVNRQTQETIGIYTSYAIIIDDFPNDYRQDLKLFNSRVLRGAMQSNKVLQCFVEFLVNASPSFGQFGGDMIIKSSLEFVSACYFEVEEGQRLHFTSNAPAFPRYVRLKTGVSETYSFFAFPEYMLPEDLYLKHYLPAIPDLTDFFDYVNDIFSFYKEFTTIGDDRNFVLNSAQTHSMDIFQVLQNLCSEAREIIHRLCVVSNVQVQSNMKQLVHGYIMYHLSQSRYRLAELGIPEAAEASRRL